MKTTPRVSVIMPAYNVEQFVAEAIESILNQTFTDFEFIIVNDGSTDNTAKIITEYAKKDKRIKFINNKKNAGFITASNQCLDIAKGEYIAKMDSDDVSLPTRLEKQVKFLDENDEIGMVGAAYQIFGGRETTIKNPEHVGILDLLYGCCTTIVMFRRKIIEKYHLRYNMDFFACEDYDFYSRFITHANIANLQEVLYKYRWHGTNVSLVKAEQQRQKSDKVRRNILDNICCDKALKDFIFTNIHPSRHFCFKLFGIIPLLKTRGLTYEKKRRFYLFGFIPLIKLKDDKVYLFDRIRIGTNYTRIKK